MITIDVTAAKRRFGRTPRKQWQFEITAANGEPIDPRDTAANVGDIRSTLRALLIEDEIQLRVHYLSGVQVETFRQAAPDA